MASISSENISKLRSSDVKKDLFDENYIEVNEYVCKSKLPNGKYVIGRMMALCRQPERGIKTMSRDDASKIVASELREDWIDKNVYPAEMRTVAKKIKYDYEQFREMRKRECNVLKTKTEAWYKKAKDFNEKMTRRAYDVRAQNVAYQKQLESVYKVVMTDDDIAFYEDNCRGNYTAICTRSVPRNWTKQEQRKKERQKATVKRKADELMTLTNKGKLLIENLNKDTLFDSASEMVQDSELNDPSFFVPTSNASRITTTESETNVRVTRSRICESSDTGGQSGQNSSTFPKVKIRTGRRTLNEALMRCLVQCLSEHRVTTEDLRGIVVKIANIVFGQEWSDSDKSQGEEPETDGDIKSSDDENNDAQDEMEIKRRRISNDLTYVMPTRQCISAWLEDASYMNLELVANYLVNKGNSVVTIGLDDTTKAAGHKLFDVKSDHITIAGPSFERKSLTTGYIENISHLGKDGADAYEFKLKCLSILVNTTVEDIKGQVDFWMTDRASDYGILLEHLGVDKDKILKCCAHVSLGIDHAIDKVFRDTEQRIGVSKLIHGEKVLLSTSSSIHTLGLIAITKLLSPSHASHSISLYNEYITWMEVNNITHDGFTGFRSNRFGRIAELAKEFLKCRESIMAFFEAVVDENANKLVLAVSTFVANEWFLCCAEVYSLIGEQIIFPILELLGIDNRQNDKNAKHTWAGVKDFFKSKIPLLDTLKVRFGQTVTGKGKLIGRVLEEVTDTLKRQLSQMDYFEVGDVVSMPDEEKLHYAPLTNLGCESEFAKLDNRVRVSGGMTSVSTHSKKNIVATNGLLVDSQFMNKTESEKKLKWKWGRNSKETRTVRKLETDFLETVKSAKRLSLIKKEELKRKKSQKTINLLEKCKEHGGPITPNSIQMMTKLTENQLLSEIAYLRVTLAPDIRQKRRVKTDRGQFTFEKFSIPELQQSIKIVIKPDCNVTVSKNIDSLLQDALCGL